MGRNVESNRQPRLSAWEVTSSGLTEEWKEVSPNKHRVGEFTHKVNYGKLLIDWQQADPEIKLSLKNVDGKVFSQQTIALSTISPYPVVQ